MDCKMQGVKAAAPKQTIQASSPLNWQHHLEAVVLALHLYKQHFLFENKATFSNNHHPMPTWRQCLTEKLRVC